MASAQPQFQPHPPTVPGPYCSPHLRQSCHQTAQSSRTDQSRVHPAQWHPAQWHPAQWYPACRHPARWQRILAPVVGTGFLLLSVMLLLGRLSTAPVYAQVAVDATPTPPVGGAVDRRDTPTAFDDPEILGGQEATPGAWPWQVALVYSYAESAFSGQFCGGSLIAPEWVLTAAHCVEYTSATAVDVVLGQHQLSSNDGERISVDDIVIYPDYVSPFVGGDLALLHLRQPSSQTVVTLDGVTAIVAEERSLNATVVGWGATDDYLASSDVLRQVTLPLVSLETCRAAYYYDEIADEMLCAGYRKGAKSACYGDSGGPLLIPTEGSGWTQIGIVSWGRGGCSGFNNYNVYTRVASYLGWIEGCLQGAPDSACVSTDHYEPDNDPATATLITTDGISQTHNFDRLDDTDWLQFDAEAGARYWIETFALGDNSDTILWLYDTDGVTALAYNDDDHPYNHRRSLLFWQAPADGRYYLEVDSHWQGQRAKTNYDIRIFTIASRVFIPNVNQNHGWPAVTPAPEPTLLPIPE
ncbi:MAG TPA: trypsin-like serine protease [Caldilineaceae bacterium]|nr:trypsin-like serine protease [Caldilineaceae bacterium]